MKPLSNRSFTTLLRSKRTKTAIVAASICVVLWLLFDWNWFRPALIDYVSEKSHRIISASDLDVDFSWSLQPTIKLRDLHIENAPWTKNQGAKPLIAVKEITFTFATFRMLFAEKRIISLISMSDGEVNLEKLENGLRNWRLLDPEYTGPGKYIVMALRARQSTIRVDDHGIQLKLLAVANPADSARQDAQNSPLNTIAFSGTYREQAFEGSAIAGETLTFQQTGLAFPITGHATSGKTSFTVDGKVGDMLRDQIIDADFRLAGSSLSSLNPFMNMHMSASHPFDAQAHLLKKGNAYTATNLQGKLGKTDVSGNLNYTNIKKSDADEKKRPLLEGTLSSKQLHLDDIMTMSKAIEPESKHSPVKDASSKKTAKDNDSTKASRLFPSTPIPLDGLNARDVHLNMKADSLIVNRFPALENIQLTVALDKGILQIAPVHAVVAGAAMDGRLTLNAEKSPLVATLLLNLDKLPADTALAIAGLHDTLSAPLSLHTELHGTGNSIAGILGDATGKLNIRAGQGTISNKLDAKLGLDAGKMLWLSIRGDKPVSLHCGKMLFDFKDGVGKAGNISLDTAQTYLEGTGTINLRNETLSLLLTPRPKDPSLFSLHSDIHVDGPLRQPKFALQRNTADTKKSGEGNTRTESGC